MLCWFTLLERIVCYTEITIEGSRGSFRILAVQKVKVGKKIITSKDFSATSSDLDVTPHDMKLSSVKRFLEEKAWLLVKWSKL